MTNTSTTDTPRTPPSRALPLLKRTALLRMLCVCADRMWLVRPSWYRYEVVTALLTGYGYTGHPTSPDIVRYWHPCRRDIDVLVRNPLSAVLDALPVILHLSHYEVQVELIAHGLAAGLIDPAEFGAALAEAA